MDFQFKDVYEMDDLLKIMSILRSPSGCPWDREQNHKTIRNNLLEEAYEAAEAIDTEDTDLLKEELGDVLLQVVFHSQMEKEIGGFDFSDVVDGISKKLIERHPHVFGNEKVKDSSEVLTNWEKIKKQTKGRRTDTDVLKGVSKALPALMRTQKVQSKAAKAAKYRTAASEAADDVCKKSEDFQKAVHAGDKDKCRQKLGELLFSAANVSRLLGFEAEQVLADSCDRFISEFEKKELSGN